MADALQTLTEINLDDLVNAFGWRKNAAAANTVRALFFRPAQDFARQMLAFDANIAARGIAEAACLAERHYVHDVQVFGADQIPAGPCIFLSNHPGMTDTLALFAALGRPDLKAIALDRPFLVSLPNLSQHLFVLADEPRQRVALVRRVGRHLQAGGSLLTFPAGHTEPDPDTYPGAIRSLESWTDSVGFFARLAPAVAVVPICVRSVTWPLTVRHPFARLRRTLDDQMLVSAAMQLLASLMLRIRPVTVKIQVGRHLLAGASGWRDTSALHHAVLDAMQTMIETGPRGAGLSML